MLTSLEFLPGYPSPRRDLNSYQELHLESYQTFASADLLTAHTVAAMQAGLSTRRYEGRSAGGRRVRGEVELTSRSSVSRRFVVATAERLAEFRSRPLDDAKWLVIFVYGSDFAGDTPQPVISREL